MPSPGQLFLLRSAGSARQSTPFDSKADAPITSQVPAQCELWGSVITKKDQRPMRTHYSSVLSKSAPLFPHAIYRLSPPTSELQPGAPRGSVAAPWPHAVAGSQ